MANTTITLLCFLAQCQTADLHCPSEQNNAHNIFCVILYEVYHTQVFLYCISFIVYPSVPLLYVALYCISQIYFVLYFPFKTFFSVF